MLVGVTLLWGLSFPLMKNWLEAAEQCPGGTPVAIFTLITLRMALALVLLGLYQPMLFTAPSGREHRIGLFIGSVFFLGYALQVLGLVWTTPAMSAFITSLGSAWVPVLVWLVYRVTIPRLTVVGLALGVTGTVVLGMAEINEGSWGQGELLTVGSSVIFAVEIVLLDRLGRTLQSGHLTVAFLAATALLALLATFFFAAIGGGVAAWLGWLAGMLRQPAVLWDIGLLTFLSTVLAFHWMNIYQPRVSAERAALVYLLEPVFGTLFSIAWGHESRIGRLLSGGGLILVGNLLVELPRWIRKRSSQ
jgi:drug/metabolite transporter (DMT)-like permease